MAGNRRCRRAVQPFYEFRKLLCDSEPAAANNTEVLKYLNDRARASLGRRYFVISEAGRIPGIKSSLPTQRARDSYEILDTTSNKFSLAAFFL